MRELSKEEIELVAGGTVVQTASQQNSVSGSPSTSQQAVWGSAFAPSATTFVQIAEVFNGASSITQIAS
jgi:hypothetical protein